MNHRPSVPASNSRIINGTALGFSILFLLASLAAACFVGEWGHVFLDWRRIMISPCPLVTIWPSEGCPAPFSMPEPAAWPVFSLWCC